MANVVTKTVRLPPHCGEGLSEPLLYNPYQQEFQRARRLRFCLNCKTIGSMDESAKFICAKCGMQHFSNLTAPRVFDHFLALAGRGGGKTLIGAHAVREELQVANGITWVMGPTFKILHDSTFPTLVKLIPPEWVQRWDPEHVEIRLVNGHLLAFRSLEDPERARGPHGVTCGWFDEAALSPERAYDVFVPTLIKAAGIVICTTTVAGFDWTYDRIERPAMEYHEGGYFCTRWWTEENPVFAQSPVMMRQIEAARKSMSPEFFAQEYRAERRNATGLIYDFSLIEKQTLPNDDAIRRLIPEWPDLSPGRVRLVGLDSGADHPFGAALGVVTEYGIIIVADYLERMKALSQHLPAITTAFSLTPGMHDIHWSANKNEAQLRLEFGLKGVGVIPAEAKHEIGIQRVASWLHSRQLYFAYTASRTIAQMKAYRYAENTTPDGQKKKEQVFKFRDELPDAIRYMLMAWPALPTIERVILTDREAARQAAMPERVKDEIARMKRYSTPKDEQDLQPAMQGYPVGDFFGGEDSHVGE